MKESGLLLEWIRELYEIRFTKIWSKFEFDDIMKKFETFMKNLYWLKTYFISFTFGLELTDNSYKQTKHKKCLNSRFFSSIFSSIRTEYGYLYCKSQCSVRMPEINARKSPNMVIFTQKEKERQWDGCAWSLPCR